MSKNNKNEEGKRIINSMAGLGKLTPTAEKPPQRPEASMSQPQSTKDK